MDLGHSWFLNPPKSHAGTFIGFEGYVLLCSLVVEDIAVAFTAVWLSYGEPVEDGMFIMRSEFCHLGADPTRGVLSAHHI
jgi:hypothetical protein